MLHEAAGALAARCVEMARLMLAGTMVEVPMARGGRKAHELDTHAQLPVSTPAAGDPPADS